MRRLILEEPVSVAAVWSRRCAVMALPVAAFGLAFGRFGFTDMPNALAVFVSALMIAVLAIVLAGFAGVNIWNTGREGLGRALTGVVLALALLAWPSLLMLRSFHQPRLNDISTDIDVPPVFDGDVRLISQRGFMPPPLSRTQREIQLKAYPDIQPMQFDIDPHEAFATAEATLKTLGWKELDAHLPFKTVFDGRIEARSRSLLMGIPYAVSIRIRPTQDGSRIDIRAVSNLGTHDFGANADVIRRFQAAFQTELEAR